MRLKIFSSWTVILWSILSVCQAQQTDVRFEHITSKQGLPQSTIHGIVKDKYGFMWFGTWAGLCRFDGYSFKVYKYNPKDSQSINNNRIHNIIKDNNGDLWVLTFLGDELCRYNYEKDNFDRVSVKKVSSAFMNLIGRNQHKNTINYSYKDFNWSLDNVRNQLVRKNITTGEKKYYQFNSANTWSLNSSNASDIYLDNHLIFWVGTSGYGVNKANLNAKPFEYYYHDPFTSNSLADNYVSAVSEDHLKRIWVGTRDNGITLIDRNVYRHFREGANSIVNNQIRTIFCDSRGIVWIGTKRGLSSFNPAEGTFRTFNQKGLENINVYSVTEDSEKNIWIGSWNGVYLYKPFKDLLQHLEPAKALKHLWVRTIIRDRRQQLWIGTEGGGISILRFNKDGGITPVKHFQHHENAQSISDNRVYCLYEDREGLIWIGTGSGLNLYNPNTNIITNLPLGSKLDDASIAGIVEDQHGVMWISHKKGIARLDKKSFQIRNYTHQDGLQSDEFADGAVYKSRFTNKLYFGSTNGLNVFHSDSIHADNTLPNTVLTGLEILNSQVDINDTINGRVVLAKPLYLTKEIVLTNEDKSFSIEFAALHYANPQGNRYAYKLEGFDKDWVYTDASRRIANYSNLDPGNYIFKVISSNSDGKWNKKPAVLNISVRPPFWASSWAYIVYFIVVLAIFYAYHYYATKFARLRSQLEYETLIHKKENDLHQSKLQFFTNISHEIKTPLTLILAPLEQLLESFSDNRTVASQLNTMRASGERLLKLVTELLSFRKLETGNVSLVLEQSDLVRFLRRVIDPFLLSAETKGIQLELAGPESPLIIPFDSDKLEKAVANIISNALKFAYPKSVIVVRTGKEFSDNDAIVFIEVINTGPEISDDDKENIFKPFQQAAGNKLGGTGLGLAYSRALIELHGGTLICINKRFISALPETCFRIQLPMRSGEFIAEVLEIEGDTARYTNIDPHFESQTLGDPAEKVFINGRQPLILLVEDNQELRRYLKFYFKRFYQVIDAENGSKGLEKALQELPDLIISDIMMPEMNGFELCKAVKSDPQIAHIPVILLTAREPIEDKIEGIELGADDYITKPFNLKFLTSKILSLLENKNRLKIKYRNTLLPDSLAQVPLSADEVLIKKLFRFIDENIENPDLGIDDICNEVAVGRTKLYKKVKTLTGLSTVELIREIRLKRAQELLKDKKFNVNEVAYMVGFADADYFRRCFKSEFGIPPSEYNKVSVK